jgi:hypothetical protein
MDTHFTTFRAQFFFEGTFRVAQNKQTPGGENPMHKHQQNHLDKSGRSEN